MCGTHWSDCVYKVDFFEMILVEIMILLLQDKDSESVNCDQSFYINTENVGSLVGTSLLLKI